MPFEKGHEKFGGKKKGTPNKSTKKSRELFLEMMAGNVEKVQTALDEIYKTDKKQYLYILNRYFPYYMPRQEQIDISIDSTDLPFNITIESREKTNT